MASGPTLTAPLMERLWAKVVRDPDTECWEWTGAKDNHGYGKIQVGRRGQGVRFAHRLLYEATYGIPDGLELDHLCRNPGCINPRHIEPVTHRENLKRSRFGRKTHCPAGHSYDNAIIKSNGKRVCRECNRLRCAARWARQRAVR